MNCLPNCETRPLKRSGRVPVTAHSLFGESAPRYPCEGFVDVELPGPKPLDAEIFHPLDLRTYISVERGFVGEQVDAARLTRLLWIVLWPD